MTEGKIVGPHFKCDCCGCLSYWKDSKGKQQVDLVCTWEDMPGIHCMTCYKFKRKLGELMTMHLDQTVVPSMVVKMEDLVFDKADGRIFERQKSREDYRRCLRCCHLYDRESTICDVCEGCQGCCECSPFRQ